MVLHKYSGSGNDFLIFHSFVQKDRSHLAKILCDRHNGIGADGLVVLIPHSKYAYTWEFYNSDGSRAKMCGNASRCVAHYAYSQHLAPPTHSFLTQAGEIKVSIKEDTIESNLGPYRLLEEFELDMAQYSGKWYLVDTGVPHLVHFVSDFKKLPYTKNNMLKTLRKRYDANVNIALIQNSHKIYLSTYERGVEDITLACGTGMAAVFAIAHLFYKTDSKTILIPPGKEELLLSFSGKEIIYEGRVKFVGICIVPDSDLELE
ncbi:diaminopimelate epimerase [Helicobacter sp. 11S03491-1]|uniref:diaminopimelate epimerase n=1 Tax=Helicobacter sp. 11S03491-1 TaxID=1476196 RepID=UPI000BA7CA70|nr:diaminopimelate epimerase [Helicobacter sp. 11S03491-1]PAF41469.1 diaminopimelate epimerase [Helicobacter sp. 11S03491-1]